MVSPMVNINCADHGIQLGTPMREQYGTYGPVTIGSDCWLGAMVVVLKGVTIGDGAVVGAGAVVTTDIPEYAIAVGVPAKVVGERM
ncbi:MAG: maltose O-acetyltransferase [Actinobacteria bacterium]|nr:maltose O-acetyltransferase [Actinomycetota bacterium]MBU4218146.1 maltose O-acetyltransferase [Actinomycetota bacterium]MBU4358571.1 maltose O-acetyltransferase [Actinomycetota bacterium]MBU4392112.1 maltose O-acetyltransferase [Actinomycetota bacterium]MBU4403161.1 maltose O-acetyltransferase [Actinomycetota bacterium]